MNAQTVLNDFIIRKEAELSLVKARYNSLLRDMTINNDTNDLKYTIKLSKLDFRVRLITDDLRYLNDKIIKDEDSDKVSKLDVLNILDSKITDLKECMSSNIDCVIKNEFNKIVHSQCSLINDLKVKIVNLLTY